MKLVKFLDQKGTILVLDPLNQTLLKNLVVSEASISELAAKLNLPTLKLWRRMQKLLKANLIEIVRTEKVGNIKKSSSAPQQQDIFPNTSSLSLNPKTQTCKKLSEFTPRFKTKLPSRFQRWEKCQMELTQSILPYMQAYNHSPKSALIQQHGQRLQKCRRILEILRKS